MITAVVLIVETYAWFVGITTVNVSNFDIQVSSSESFELSLDGENWKSGSRTFTISQDSLTLTSKLPIISSNSLSNKGLLKNCRVIQMCGFGSLAEYYKKSCTMNYAALP